jgi:hypothetical protein
LLLQVRDGCLIGGLAQLDWEHVAGQWPLAQRVRARHRHYPSAAEPDLLIGDLRRQRDLTDDMKRD